MNRDRGKITVNSNDKLCRKPGHNHICKYYPDNKYRSKYQSGETNTNEKITERRCDNSQERDEIYHEEKEVYLIIPNFEEEQDSKI